MMMLKYHHIYHQVSVQYFVNIFFVDPKRGKRKPSRWFEPIEKSNFEQELPAEWEGMCPWR